MTVALLPPTTGYLGPIAATALLEGPRYLRNPTMSYWHRPRSGRRDNTDQVVTYDLWCGPYVRGHLALTTETVPPGERVCATCDGRAVGAGQEENGPTGRTLAFQARYLKPPRYCPGSRTTMFAELGGGRVGRCLVCRDHHPLRAMNGPYDAFYGITQHTPGPGLVQPCPFHRWKALSARDGRIYCPCDTELTSPEHEGQRA